MSAPLPNALALVTIPADTETLLEPCFTPARCQAVLWSVEARLRVITRLTPSLLRDTVWVDERHALLFWLDDLKSRCVAYGRAYPQHRSCLATLLHRLEDVDPYIRGLKEDAHA